MANQSAFSEKASNSLWKEYYAWNAIKLAEDNFTREKVFNKVVQSEHQINSSNEGDFPTTDCDESKAKE